MTEKEMLLSVVLLKTVICDLESTQLKLIFNFFFLEIVYGYISI